jgi:hypothetical protein
MRRTGERKGKEMTEKVKKGDRVHVEFDGTVDYAGDQAILVHPDEAPIVHSVDNRLITLLDPAGWPPRVGDIWQAEGGEFYTRACRLESKRREVVIESMDGEPVNFWEGSEDRSGLEDFKALRPVLVRRREHE